jgi:hypothetical protein
MSQWSGWNRLPEAFKQSTLFEVSADGLVRHWPFAGNEKSGHERSYHLEVILHHCHGPYQRDGIGRGKRLDERSKQEQELKPIWYNGHKYDTTDRSGLEAHQL